MQVWEYNLQVSIKATIIITLQVDPLPKISAHLSPSSVHHDMHYVPYCWFVNRLRDGMAFPR